jgi:hypothetical protein
MKVKNKEKLILSLIRDDLINAKLIHCLSEAGLNADNYLLHLSDTIFNLMGFEDHVQTAPIYERYNELSKRAMFVDISESYQPMEDLALQIYTEMRSRQFLSQRPSQNARRRDSA